MSNEIKCSMTELSSGELALRRNSEKMTIREYLEDDPTLRKFCSALCPQTGDSVCEGKPDTMKQLYEQLGDPNAGPFTVFACIDQGFDNPPHENDVKLRNMLRNGILENRLLNFSEISAAINLVLGLGTEISVTKPEELTEPVTLGTAKLLAWDIICKNGIVHKVDCFINSRHGVADVAAAYGLDDVR